MNRSLYIFLFLLLIPFSFAESIGDSFKLNESMEITNYCEAGVCTYVTLMSIKYPNSTMIYPNTNMTKNGQTYNYTFIPPIAGTYSFVTCGDSTIAVCDQDTFTVVYNGGDYPLGVSIILLIFFSGLLVSFFYINRTIDFEKWHKKNVSKYEDKNFFKSITGMIGYNFVKNGFAIYYVIIFFLLIVLSDMILYYNVLVLVDVTEAIMEVYTWAVILVGISFGGQLQQYIVSVTKEIKDIKWGIRDE